MNELQGIIVPKPYGGLAADWAGARFFEYAWAWSSI